MDWAGGGLLLLQGLAVVVVSTSCPGVYVVHCCTAPLGLESGSIPDSSLTSSLPSSSPQHGRLHHPSSAWCFSSSQMSQAGQEDVTLEILLARPSLLSGVQSQGPPSALHDEDYMRYISFTVEVWHDEGWEDHAEGWEDHDEGWEDCCGAHPGRTHFYADDQAGQAGLVTTHPFGGLVVADRVRIRVSASLRWIGHDQKCFRFELLGCDSR